MGYLFGEIVVYLVGAGLIGFVFGWLVRDGALDKYFDKLIAFFRKPTSIKRQEEQEAVKQPEVSVEKVEEQTLIKPLLLTKAPEKQDKLSSIKGIGNVLEKKLNELGIYTFEQIVSWNVEQEEWISTQIGFPKKVTREAWVKQAKELC